MKHSTVIVLGISGVGKTTLCEAFVAKHKTFLHFSASKLLQAATGCSPDRLRLLPKESIIKNQNLLGEALFQKMAGREGYNLIIDAHTIIDNETGLVVVPIEPIASLNPKGFIFLHAAPEVLLQRRLTDNRKRPYRTATELRKQQSIAKGIAYKYARALHKKINLIQSDKFEDFDDAVVNIAES
ncbi:AAA family ATPase [Methylobacterium sp. WCS2018Hpa-22]|uniref:ATP-binding protein n=1 Tax=Methylobacterium sp. WCS2018Hpa-22 TaxID=3073633 RepID=UPI00288975F8|nr:AAA family ATPase [Methylobacterium sp. WCS2018Hpa-22]